MTAVNFVEKCEVKSVTFDGTAGKGQAGTVALFTVNGAVRVRLVAICTANLVEGVGGGTLEVGIAGGTATFIAQSTSTDIDAGEIWHDATPDSGNELWSVTATTAERLLAAGQDIIATVGTRDITGGTIVFTAFWTPITPGSSLLAA